MSTNRPAKVKAKCEYPACDQGLSVLKGGLCPKHCKEIDFLIWLLSAKLRIGAGGPFIGQLLSGTKTLLEEAQIAASGKALLYSPGGGKLR